jgi:hypothetical protein
LDKLAALMDDSEHDVLAYMTFSGQHRTKLHSITIGTLEQRGQTAGRCRRHLPQRGQRHPADRAVLLEQNDEWLPQCRYMQIEGMAELTPPLIDADPAKLPPIAA